MCVCVCVCVCVYVCVSEVGVVLQHLASLPSDSLLLIYYEAITATVI